MPPGLTPSNVLGNEILASSGMKSSNQYCIPQRDMFLFLLLPFPSYWLSPFCATCNIDEFANFSPVSFSVHREILCCCNIYEFANFSPISSFSIVIFRDPSRDYYLQPATCNKRKVLSCGDFEHKRSVLHVSFSCDRPVFIEDFWYC